jgi:hypothetical protein
VDADVVEGEGGFAPAVVFPDQGGLVGVAELADAIAAVPADVDGLAVLVPELALGDGPVEAPAAFLVGGRHDVSNLR